MNDPCEYCDFIGPFVNDEQPVRDFHRAWHDLARTAQRAFGPLLDAFSNITAAAQGTTKANYALTAVPEPELPALDLGHVYQVTTNDEKTFLAQWSPIDGIRANHPWLRPGAAGTRYRQDYITRAIDVEETAP